MIRLFDAHCHLEDAALFPDLGNVLERAAAAGVEALAASFDFSNAWKKEKPFFQTLETGCIGNHTTFQGLEKPPVIFPGIGIHPWFVSRDWKKDFQTLEACCIGAHSFFQGMENDAPKMPVGIGETGLDFQDRFNNRAEQEECFAAHLDLARKLDRPVTVHCVKAWGRLLEILRDYPEPNKILHAFGGAVELIPELTGLNCWFSFCGNVTNPNAKRVRAAAAAVPAGRLLIETDAPDFPPAGCAAPNEPANLIHIARAIAGLRAVPLEDICRLTFDNAQKLFTARVRQPAFRNSG